MEPLTPNELSRVGMAASKTFDHEKKDLENYVLAARTLIHAALGLAETYPDKATNYKRIAVNTSFNIAAACWPGWEDAHPDITEEQRALAMEMCLFNVAMAEALDLPAGPRANSHWILGAHLLANRNYAAARESFQLGGSLSVEGDSTDGALMAQGWVHACDILAGDTGKRAELDSVIAELKTLGEDGEFYASQYDPALKVFS